MLKCFARFSDFDRNSVGVGGSIRLDVMNCFSYIFFSSFGVWAVANSAVDRSASVEYSQSAPVHFRRFDSLLRELLCISVEILRVGLHLAYS